MPSSSLIIEGLVFFTLSHALLRPNRKPINLGLLSIGAKPQGALMLLRSAVAIDDCVVKIVPGDCVKKSTRKIGLSNPLLVRLSLKIERNGFGKRNHQSF